MLVQTERGSARMTSSQDFFAIAKLGTLCVMPGGVWPMIANHAGRNRKTAHSYQHRRRVHIKLL